MWGGQIRSCSPLPVWLQINQNRNRASWEKGGNNRGHTASLLLSLVCFYLPNTLSSKGGRTKQLACMMFALLAWKLINPADTSAFLKQTLISHRQLMWIVCTPVQNKWERARLFWDSACIIFQMADTFSKNVLFLTATDCLLTLLSPLLTGDDTAECIFQILFHLSVPMQRRSGGGCLWCVFDYQPTEVHRCTSVSFILFYARVLYDDFKADCLHTPQRYFFFSHHKIVTRFTEIERCVERRWRPYK